jgi:hypothetical protein
MPFKTAKIKVGSDVIPFQRFELDMDGNPTEPNDNGVYKTLCSNPKVVNVNHLDYVPLIGSEWNGTDFIDPLLQEVRPVRRQEPDPDRFSFMLDNKHKIYYVLSKHEKNEMLSAALSSDPEFIVE